MLAAMGGEALRLVAIMLALASPEAPPPDPRPAEGDGSGEESIPSRLVRVGEPRPQPSLRARAASVVTRTEMEERLPRSAPDALRYEPGVFVQQTAHGQASPYVRGLTGQQTVMFFDDVRVNNSTFRQGPNQYFFTIDSRTLERLEVVRGSASTRFGSDALGGALLSTPIGPRLGDATRRWAVHGKGFFRTATADATIGGRAQLEVVRRGRLGLLAGVGYRTVGELRSGGRLEAPGTGMPQTVPPLFEADGETQRGTGFDELTADARLVWQANARHRFTAAYYDYRQFDAPRTDKCPPPTAPTDECLTYDEQFRTLVYGAHESTGGPAAARRTRVTLSYQRQHEDRTLDRGDPSFTLLFGQDTVHSVGVSARVETETFEPAHWLRIGGHYGFDAYFDVIDSHAQQFFEDTEIGVEQPRGQYLDGARYLTSGSWAETQVDLGEALHLRGGGRVAVVDAFAEENEASRSLGVDRTWASAVAGGGLAVDAVRWLTFTFNADQGFRAPNLDDLTSRQQTGPGFQFENAALEPERSLTLETGATVRLPWLELDAWGYRTALRDLIGRVAVDAMDCPQGSEGCGTSRTRFKPANISGLATLWGAEGSVLVRAPHGFWARATLAWARGDRPNPFGSAAEDNLTVPMSRVPPLHGTGQLGWRASFGLGVAAAVQWARLQDRLAPQDIADARIPEGGTPGYVVVELRAHYRLEDRLFFGLVFENVGDAAWRAHGSSVNGPGRGLIVEAQLAF